MSHQGLFELILLFFISDHICRQLCTAVRHVYVLLKIRTQTQLQPQLSASLLTPRFLTTGGATVCLKESPLLSCKCSRADKA